MSLTWSNGSGPASEQFSQVCWNIRKYRILLFMFICGSAFYPQQTMFVGYTVFMSICPHICPSVTFWLPCGRDRVSNKHCLLTFLILIIIKSAITAVVHIKQQLFLAGINKWNVCTLQLAEHIKTQKFQCMKQAYPVFFMFTMPNS